MSIEFSYQMPENQLSEQDFEQTHDDDYSNANITSQSSIHEEISETDSSINEQNIEIKSETYDEEPHQQQSTQAASSVTAYQQNCLAAAQMMQLLYAKSESSSVSSTTNSSQDIINKQASPNGENEKENIPVCKYCSKVFANFSNLNHHVSAIHLNQSKWVCSQCGKICSSKSNLKVHLRVHLRVKPYHCRWCSYSCMHHSSIRDHLAKLHPDKAHTPLQPGYLFNSQAVPEPDVFNAKGFNVNSFVSDSKMKRSLESSPSSDRSPEKQRQCKKARLSNEQKSLNRQERSPNLPIQSYNPLQSPPLDQMYQQMQTNKASFPNQNFSNNSNSQNNISNLYNAYNMARMFPFMYNPAMQMQYSNQQQQQSSPSNYLSILNQNMIQMQNRSQLDAFSNNNNQSSSSDDHAPNSSVSNFSYSNSSRGSSLSPEAKTESSKQSHDDSLSFSVKVESTIPITPVRANPKKILSVDQMLGIDSKKQSREIETQTDESCLRCSHCNHSV